VLASRKSNAPLNSERGPPSRSPFEMARQVTREKKKFRPTSPLINKQRIDFGPIETSPGPGQYNISSQVTEKKALGKFLNSSREQSSVRSDSPGPGAYKINESLTKFRTRDIKFEHS